MSSTVNRLFVLVSGLVATLALAGTATAAAPVHEIFVSPYSYVDTSECGFPISVEGVFTNRIIDSAAATGTGTLELHQSDVATLTANGVTLRVNDHFTIFVTYSTGCR